MDLKTLVYLQSTNTIRVRYELSTQVPKNVTLIFPYLNLISLSSSSVPVNLW